MPSLLAEAEYGPRGRKPKLKCLTERRRLGDLILNRLRAWGMAPEKNLIEGNSVGLQPSQIKKEQLE